MRCWVLPFVYWNSAQNPINAEFSICKAIKCWCRNYRYAYERISVCGSESCSLVCVWPGWRGWMPLINHMSLHTSAGQSPSPLEFKWVKTVGAHVAIKFFTHQQSVRKKVLLLTRSWPQIAVLRERATVQKINKTYSRTLLRIKVGCELHDAKVKQP